jgi:O-antigen ligase
MQRRGRGLTNQPTLQGNWKERLPELCFHAGLYALILTIPFHHITSIRDAGTVLLFAGWFAMKKKASSWKIRYNPLVFPLACFLAAILYSLISCHDFDYTIHKIWREFVITALIFFIIADYCDNAEKILKIFSAFIIANIATLCYFIVQFFYLHLDLTAFINAIGDVDHPEMWINAGRPRTSSYFLFSSIFLYTALFHVKQLKTRLVVSVLFLLNILFLLLMNQRSALIGVFLAFLAIVVIRRQLLKKVLAVTGISLLLCLTVILSTPLRSMIIHENLSRIKKMDFKDEKDAGALIFRIQVMQYAWQYIMQHPFTGVGYGRKNFAGVVEKLGKKPPHGVNHAHNVFVSMAVHTGIQGLLAFMAILVTQYGMAWKALAHARDRFESFFLTATLLYMTGFWTRMLFDDLFRRGIALNYWIIIGLMTGMFMNYKENAQGKKEY